MNPDRSRYIYRVLIAIVWVCLAVAAAASVAHFFFRDFLDAFPTSSF